MKFVDKQSNTPKNRLKNGHNVKTLCKIPKLVKVCRGWFKYQ